MELTEVTGKRTEKEDKIFDLLVLNGEQAKEKVKVLSREADEMRGKAENLRVAINDLGNALCQFGYRIS